MRPFSLIPISCACLLALFASGCSSTRPTINTTILPPVPVVDERLLELCPDEVNTVDGLNVRTQALPATATEKGWNTDRARLRQCRNKDTGLVQAYRELRDWSDQVVLANPPK